jgi:phosphoribosylformylglycinamidine synthase
VLYLVGERALSVYEEKRILAAMQQAGSAVQSITATRVYWLDAVEEDQDGIAGILQATPGAYPSDENGCWFLPRPGSRSPWSSKATDILQLCGYSHLRHVETGFYFQFFLDVDPPNKSEDVGRAPSAHALRLDRRVQEDSDAVEAASAHALRLDRRVQEDSDAVEAASAHALRLDRRVQQGSSLKGETELSPDALGHCFDRMTQACVFDPKELEDWFSHAEAKKRTTYPLLSGGEAALNEISQELGLALQQADRDHLLAVYQRLEREPTGAELMMFAQVNSEHCRHKVFNSSWKIDGVAKEDTLFSMIRHTYKTNPGRVAVAYSDNAAVIESSELKRWLPCATTGEYQTVKDASGIVLKVETHNHPTGISPYPGAATGSGGEIRDEAATGRGATVKMGMVGFAVSNLQIPGATQPWEHAYETPSHLASSLSIMLEAPMGAAAYNNEFGRPALTGFFRTLATPFSAGNALWGFHKPLMIAGGVGQIRMCHAHKKPVQAGDALLVLGGPGMLIGLGGGALSSQQLSTGSEELDYASVQRANPEMQRRAQEVIQACFALGKENPIESIHDVGAGGLCNALPELVEADGLGAEIDLHSIPVAESGMSPMEIWCNESQERYVLAVRQEAVAQLQAIAKRERAPLAVVGKATKEKRLHVYDSLHNNAPVDMPMADLFDCNTALFCQDERVSPTYTPVDWERFDLAQSIERVLSHPTVADKSFLISIGDRSVGGLVARDQMVGPWQIPVADVAVTAGGFHERSGEAMATGERSPVAILDATAAAGLALGEALTNLAAAKVTQLGDVALSANWMSAVSFPGEGAALYDAVQAIGKEICPDLKICIPVGKDSLSMRSHWQTAQGDERDVVSPQALVITAAAPVADINNTWAPMLQPVKSALLLIDLSAEDSALGASIFAQVNSEMGVDPARLASSESLRHFFVAMQALHEIDLVLAYHDRSDGGLLATVAEMMFAGHSGVDLHMPSEKAVNPFLFNEGLGAVIQVAESDLDTVLTLLDGHKLGEFTFRLGGVNTQDSLRIYSDEKLCYEKSRVDLGRYWSSVSYEMQKLRDNPETAQMEYDRWLDVANPGLSESIHFSVETIKAQSLLVKTNEKPRVAILREQGVNGHAEMAGAFAHVGFTSVDVHMDDLLSGRRRLDEFVGLVACGGFSYGDVLGAGRGWAQVILNNAGLTTQFRDFFANPKRFALGVCNGCQMLSQLQSLIPGSDHWPRFTYNASGRFESRVCLTKVEKSPSLFFQGMEGSVLSVVAAHGEGKTQWPDAQEKSCLSYVDNRHQVTESYPENPNGSVAGQTAFTNNDGRITIMMPHPERVFLLQQQTWKTGYEMGESPWWVFFNNARQWVGEKS